MRGQHIDQHIDRLLHVFGIDCSIFEYSVSFTTTNHVCDNPIRSGAISQENVILYNDFVKSSEFSITLNIGPPNPNGNSSLSPSIQLSAGFNRGSNAQNSFFPLLDPWPEQIPSIANSRIELMMTEPSSCSNPLTYVIVVAGGDIVAVCVNFMKSIT